MQRTNLVEPPGELHLQELQGFEAECQPNIVRVQQLVQLLLI